MPPRAWKWVGDRALLREFAGADVSATNGAARALYHAIHDAAPVEVEDLIPGASSLLVLLRPGTEPSAALTALLDRGTAVRDTAEKAPVHELRVAYGGEHGPDLEEVARLHRLDAARLVELHAAAVYTVGFLGFAPGFAYLLGLPEALATPRLATPRTRVPAGSVAIGGAFTAVYPSDTPGGWRIIGHCDETLFDHRDDPPARLRPGDRVRFVAQ